ncbi:MAG: hypothetical protein Q9217_006436 [Psora testacea]
MYLLGSVSKTFVAAAAGIAVDEGKLEWDGIMSQYVPELNPVGDPEITSRGTVKHFLMHTSGLARPQLLVMGPRGLVLGKEEDFTTLMNHATTRNQHGQRFDSWFLYNNFSFGLVAMAIQNIYDKERYVKWLRRRLLSPLGMARTAIAESDVSQDGNVAHPYNTLEDGSTVKIRADNWTSQAHTPILAAMGMRSSVNDMLKWAYAVLEAEEREQSGRRDVCVRNDGTNPLRNVSATRQCEWYLPTNRKDEEGLAYGLGWARMTTPISALGWLSFNCMTRNDDANTNQFYVLGKDTPPLTVIYHGGVMPGSSCALYTFPQTQSAIVAFANGIQDGDAADFTAQVMLQALFDLEPKIDLLPLVSLEAEKRHNVFFPQILAEWHLHRNLSAKRYPTQDYEGEYEGHGGTTIQIFPLKVETLPNYHRPSQNHHEDQLAVTFNRVPGSVLALEFYNQDVFSFLPTTQDEWLREAMIDWDYYKTGLLEFQRDDSNGDKPVSGLLWQWDEFEEPTLFHKTS